MPLTERFFEIVLGTLSRLKETARTPNLICHHEEAFRPTRDLLVNKAKSRFLAPSSGALNDNYR
jgi:hypothetical protein